MKGSFAGRIFKDDTSSPRMSDTSVMNTSTLEVYRQEGTMEVLHYTVLMEGTPGRYIEWHHTDESMTSEWNGTTLGDRQILFSRTSDIPVAEDRMRAASIGDFKDDGASIGYIAVAIPVIAILVFTTTYLMRRRSRS